MTDLVLRNFSTGKKYSSTFFRNIIDEALLGLGVDIKNLEISVNLVGEKKIRALNKKYRKKDRITDVLSFPLVEKFKILRSELETVTLGDIFICYPFAKKAAKRENISIDDKIRNLTVHGFLHLLGYDHERSLKEEKEMFSLESDILKKLNS